MMLAALTSTCALLAPASASGALKSIWGPTELPNGTSAFPVYRDLGVDVYQTVLPWAGIAVARPANPRDPDDPAYHWLPEVDTAVQQGRKYRIPIALQAVNTPPWANGGRAERYAPSRDSDYANFLIAASRRYPSVRHWMIWGEPSRAEAFQPMPKNKPRGPRRYARLLDAAYHGLKAESRDNVVIGAMTFTNGAVKPHDFARWMRLPSGLPPRLDWWGHNPFSRRYPRVSEPVARSCCRDFNDIDKLILEVNKAYRPRRQRPPLWLSEFSIQTDHASNTFNFWTTKKGQAHWVKAAYREANRLGPSIAGLGWYRLTDQPRSPRSENWGLMDASGHRKPSYHAYRAAPGS